MSVRVIPTFTTFAVALLAAAASGAQQPAPAANPLDVVPEKMPFNIPYGPPIALERARALIAAAIAEAKKRDWKLNVAVVDSGGSLVAFERMDGAQLASIQIAEHKARAAATFRRETKAFENAIQVNGSNYIMTLDGSWPRGAGSRSSRVASSSVRSAALAPPAHRTRWPAWLAQRC